jgi:hypothetical protein
VGRPGAVVEAGGFYGFGLLGVGVAGVQFVLIGHKGRAWGGG